MASTAQLLLWSAVAGLVLEQPVRRAARPCARAPSRLRMATEAAPSTFVDDFDGRLPDWLLERAATIGYTHPTAVQRETLHTVLDGHDAIVQAKTGSGKTLAYLLPLLAQLRPTSAVQALVLLPTRELAAQVARAARQLAAGSPDRLLVMALLDGSGAKRQRKWLLAQPPQVVVGNVQQADSVLRVAPRVTGRLLGHAPSPCRSASVRPIPPPRARVAAQAGLLKLGGLRMLVVDEVDECLATDATRTMLHELLSTQLRVPAAAPGAAARQTLFVSATVPQRNHFAAQCAQRGWCAAPPRLLHVQPEQPLPEQLRHAYAVCAEPKRFAALRVLLRADAAAAGAGGGADADADADADREDATPTTIVFVKEGRPLAKMAAALAGVVEAEAPAVLSAERDLGARASAVRAVRDGARKVLLATYGEAARGLDIPHCSRVVLFDLPRTADAYTHAAGRCGRMGRPGKVTTICTEKELFVLQRIANSLQLDFERVRR